MTVHLQLARLAESWDRLMDTCNVSSGEAHSYSFSQLIAAYSEPHRYWHNLDHIESLLAHLRLPRHRLADALASLELAVWYHDVVYDTRSLENESRSAEFATNALRGLGLDEGRIARVSDLILMTKSHHAPECDTPALYFLDADLSILGTNEVLYPEYAADIRKEYGWVPEREYCQGRRKVLLSFLHRPRIFRTDWFGQWESNARANITREIAEIDAKLRTLA